LSAIYGGSANKKANQDYSAKEWQPKVTGSRTVQRSPISVRGTSCSRRNDEKQALNQSFLSRGKISSNQKKESKDE
jgi:hypothetical protein